MAALSGVDKRRKITLSIVVAIITAAAVAATIYITNLGAPPAESGPEIQQAQPLPSLNVTDPVIKPPAGRITKLSPKGDAPTPAGVQAQMAGVINGPRQNALAQFTGAVMDPATGGLMFDQGADQLVLPASTTKLLTGAAVLNSLNPQARLTTKVVVGDEPGDIILVGGGDVTLSARTAGEDTVYEGAPHIRDLAQQVIDSGYVVKRIVLDTNHWKGPELADGWKVSDIAGIGGGSITNMQALMVDGARLNPASENSRRSATPAKDAGKALGEALGLEKVQVIAGGQASPDAQVLGQVQSQPIGELLSQALENSDNVLAEALAREVALARGAPASFTGAAAATKLALEDLKIKVNGKTRPVDVAGLELKDASGVSNLNRASTRSLAEVLVAAVQAQNTDMRALITGLPVAGASGTLQERFNQPDALTGRGWVRAKTGSLDVTYALAGLVVDKDDRILVFAFNSNGVFGDPVNGTRPAQDALAASLRACGCS
ncbi:D-alanyl-D-alanine carboxypeptidase/D-alanyl-D-alanine-endopeptidase [Nakamurella silvestris]|nr:D-alanyl-D-alanine carboxypeptidase/D-alanyl-D-alanine-endopeptidase [Nakamurella silvestris]